jgi:hypothetical protein
MSVPNMFLAMRVLKIDQDICVIEVIDTGLLVQWIGSEIDIR